MKLASYILVAFACAINPARAQTSVDPGFGKNPLKEAAPYESYIRANREAADRDTELKRKQEEATRKQYEEMNRLTEQQAKRKQLIEEAARKRADEIMAEISRTKQPDRTIQKSVIQNSLVGSDAFGKRISLVDDSLKVGLTGTPKVLQRKEISRDPIYKTQAVTNPGSGEKLVRVISGYRVTYKNILDNGTVQMETITE